jgi:hypothetical protein
MTERWSTTEEIIAARDRLERGLGWRRPAAHAVARETGGQIEFVRINIDENYLPAVVLASVVGHRGGSASYRLTATDLDAAIDMLAPAEACTEYEHPNLYAWRQLLASLGGGCVIAVFVEDRAARSDDPYVTALLDAMTT